MYSKNGESELIAQLFVIMVFMKKIISFLRENKKTVLALLAVAIFADILFLNKSSDLIIFGILILYSVSIKMFQIKSKLTFLLCLTLLFTMFINYLFTETSVSTEKAAVWLVLFLIVGVIQQWRE